MVVTTVYLVLKVANCESITRSPALVSTVSELEKLRVDEGCQPGSIHIGWAAWVNTAGVEERIQFFYGRQAPIRIAADFAH